MGLEYIGTKITMDEVQIVKKKPTETLETSTSTVTANKVAFG